MMPFKNCKTQMSNGKFCWEVFKNNECNLECKTEECLWDGFDCASKTQDCNPVYNGYCTKHYGNGDCDNGCNNKECLWDGLDCDPNKEDLADGTIVIIVLVQPETFQIRANHFVRQLGILLQTVVRIKRDSQGREMIYPWYSEGTQHSKINLVKRYIEQILRTDHSRIKRAVSVEG